MSCFVGLAVICLFLPLNHYGGKVVVNAQENLMKTRDERVALMNEVREITAGQARSFYDTGNSDSGCDPYAEGNKTSIYDGA